MKANSAHIRKESDSSFIGEVMIVEVWLSVVYVCCFVLRSFVFFLCVGEKFN